MSQRPVYELIGYQINNIKYSRTELGIPLKFKLSIKESKFDNEKMLAFIFPVLEIQFRNSDPSIFEFSAIFKINDTEWKQSISTIQMNAIFISSVFPYIRSFVHHITDDVRGSINLPTIDLRMANFESGIVFEPNSKAQNNLKN